MRNYLPERDQPPFPAWSTSIDIGPVINKDALAGVRIEDEMLFTEDGYKWMTGELPRSIKDIENFMARARQKMR
jgi:hypothetical protein